MEADNRKRLDETRSQLTDCGYQRTDYRLIGISHLHSVEWWIHDDERQILIVVGDHSQFDLFRYIGDTFSSTSNLQAIADITFSKQSTR